MKLEQKVGQLFVVPAFGRFMNESSVAYRELVRQVRENHVGGVIWFLSNVYETAWLNARLQELAEVPLLVSADLESGLGMRFPEVTWWPPAMAIAATGDVTLAELQGRITAREAKLVGIDHVLAPVCDVNIDARNPVINTRSFGEDPEQVGRYASAFIHGVQAEGALATAKHFPGHGDTHVDSHRSLPRLDVERDRLDAVELVPFRAALQTGVGSVMIGHLAVPALDDSQAPVRTFHVNAYGTHEAEIPIQGPIPATVSEPIVSGLLRRELGFDGLVVTDAFDMGGLVAHFDPAEAATRAIEAGHDQIMYSENTDAAIAGVISAVRSGRLSESRIDESVARILAAKKAVQPWSRPAKRDLFESIFRSVDNAEHRAHANSIAARAVTLVRDEKGLLPLRAGNITAVVVTDLPENEAPLAEAIRLLAPARRHAIDARSGEAEALSIEGDVIVMLLAIRARSGAGRLAVPGPARLLAEKHGSRIIAVSFGSPYVINDLPSVSTYVAAFGIQPILQRAAVAALRGETHFTGRLPVTL